MPPEEVNPHPRGTLAWAEWERDHQKANPAEAGTKTSFAATKRAEQLATGRYFEAPPPGSKPNGTGNALGPDGVKWSQDADSGLWSPGYKASPTELGLTGGGGGSGYTPSDPERFTKAQAARQIAGGGTMTPPPGAVMINGGERFYNPANGLLYQKHNETQVYTKEGKPYKDDIALIRAAMAQGGGTPATPGVTASSPPTPGAPPLLDPLVAGTPLRQDQAPTFGSRALSQGAVNPATPLPTAETSVTRSLVGQGPAGANSPLNQVAIQNAGQGFSGFINPTPATGTRSFPMNERGFTAPARPFGPMSYSMPKDIQWDPERSQLSGPSGGFQPFGVNFNLPADSLDPLAPVTGGAGTLQINGPQTANVSAADKSWGMGFNPNAMAHSNIALAQGLDFSKLDPVAQAVATLALLDRQLEEDERQGTPRFAMGTRGSGIVAGVPFAGASTRPDLVTNEPIIGVGTITGKHHFLLGEDNADRDRMPDPELVRFPTHNSMQIMPLDPPRRFDEGTTGGGIVAPYAMPSAVIPNVQQHWNPSIRWDVPFTWMSGEVDDWFRSVGQHRAWDGPIPRAELMRQAQQQGGGRRFAEGTTGAGIVASSDPLAADFLQDWEQGFQQLDREQARRDRSQYRWDFAGLKGPMALTVASGDMPGRELPSNMFYDMRPSLTSSYNRIRGARDDLITLGADEDYGAASSAVTALEQEIDPWQRAQNFKNQRLGLGTLRNPADINADISTKQTQIAPWLEAQRKQQAINELGTVGDPNQINATINTLNGQLAPYQQVIGVNQKLMGMGGPKDTTGMEAQLQQMEDIIARYEANPAEMYPYEAEYQNAKNGYGPYRADFNARIAHNQELASLAEQKRIFLAGLGLTDMAEVDALTGGLQTQLQTAETELLKAQRAGQLSAEIQALIGAGVDPATIATTTGALNAQIQAAQAELQKTAEAANLQAQQDALIGAGIDPTAGLAERQGRLDPLKATASGVLSRNTQRDTGRKQVANLRAAGVPRLSGPILPVGAAA